MGKTPPYTFSDAEVLARELEHDHVVEAATPWQRESTIGVDIDLTEDAARDLGADTDSKIWVDLSSSPPVVRMPFAGDAEPLYGHLEKAVERASRLIGQGAGLAEADE